MMNILCISIVCIFSLSLKASAGERAISSSGYVSDTTSFMIGNFIDDYGIEYSINDSLWAQGPVIKYHILEWNKKEQYFIARNDQDNPTEAGLFTRIDYMFFPGMKPWLWGFCYITYNAKDPKDAKNAAIAERGNPRKGCNGFPFSRMKPAK